MIRPRQQLRFGVAEHALPRGVDALEVAVEPGDAQHVERQREEAIELLLRAPPIDEHADLVADRREHRQQVGVRRADLAAEELHHAEHFAAQQDREAERGVQPFAGGDRARAGSSRPATTSGIQAGSPLAQTRPGRPMPRGKVVARLTASNSGNSPAGSSRSRRSAARRPRGRPSRARRAPSRAPRRSLRGFSAPLRRWSWHRGGARAATYSAVSRRSAGRPEWTDCP